jgi:hypothetical protein
MNSRRGCDGDRWGTNQDVTIWWVLAVPATLALMALLLFLSGLAEQRFLSPRALILGAMRTRRNTPEYTEEFVAKQFERLLRESQRQ